MKGFDSKQLNNPTYEVGIIWFSPECILCSNVKRANVCRKCLSLRITTSQGIFGGELFGLFLLLVKYLSWSEQIILPKGEYCLYFLLKLNVLISLATQSRVLYEYFHKQVKTCFPGWSGFKGGGFFAYYALGIIMLVLSLLILSHNYEVARLVCYLYQCFLNCHRVYGIPYFHFFCFSIRDFFHGH